MRSVVALVLVVALAAPAPAVSLRRQCRRMCKETITACVEAGTRRPRCRRTVLKTCRQMGVVACGIDAPTTTTTTTTTVAAGPTTSTTLPAMLNGCELASAVDLTGQPTVTVTFQDFAYTPPCFMVSAGTDVTFSGDFGAHPLVGGEVTFANAKTPDPASPFNVPVSGTNSRTFTLAAPGAFPFYCDNHALMGMKGVAFVVP